MGLWSLHNATPFAVVGQFEKDHHAASFWGVWIKATFDIATDGRLRLSADQRPLNVAPVLSEDGRAAREDGDLTLPKTQTDILLAGVGAPPRGTAPDANFDVALNVGDWSKRLTVAPARRWVRRLAGGTLQQIDGASADVPLDYSAGYGGTIDIDGTEHRHEPNPAGCGYHVAGQGTREIMAPRLFYPGEAWRRRRDTPRPAGFSPIARHWQARAQLAGTFDTDWMQLRAPLLPVDHDPAWRQSAPPDQRYDGHLQGGETVRFTNVRGAVDLTLPTLGFDVASHFRGAWVTHDMAIQTLFLDPDAGQLTLTWCGAIPIGAAAYDVELRDTHVRLSHSEGFAVDPARVAAFHAAQGAA